MNPLNTNSAPVRRVDQRAVRKSNLSLVARRIAEAGSLSRAQLAKSTGLNKTTVSSLVAELIERGVVAESGLADGGGVGRPAQILELDDSRIAALGLEINVDYLAVCVCDLRGAVRYRNAVGHDNRESTPALAFEMLAELVAAALAECDALGLTPIGAGISVPGTVEAGTGTLIHAPNLGWDQLDVATCLRDSLGDPPFSIEVGNDANLAALGELESGALRGIRHGLLLYGNVGIGGAVIVDGAIFPGSEGFAGEIGHMPVRPFDGESCRCGGRGCLETSWARRRSPAAWASGAHGTKRRRPLCSWPSARSPATLLRSAPSTRSPSFSARPSPRRSRSSTRSGSSSPARWERSRHGCCPVRAPRWPSARWSLPRCSRSSVRNSPASQLSEGAPRSSYTTC